MTSASMVNPRPLSAASSHFNAARYRNFTVVPYCEEPHVWVCCIWHCRWRRWSRGLKELQALAAPLWATALPLSGGLALYRSFQPQFPALRSRACSPLSSHCCSTRGWGDVQGCFWQAPGAQYQGSVRLALGSMCCPTGKPAQAALPALLWLEGRRSQNSPKDPALTKDNFFFLLIVAHAEKTPKSPLQNKPLGEPDLG